jgi:hypothetical protein
VKRTAVLVSFDSGLVSDSDCGNPCQQGCFVLSKDLERGIGSDLTVDREGSQVIDMVCLEVFQSSLGQDI